MGIIAGSRLRASAIRPFIIEVDTSRAGSASDAFEFKNALGDYDVVAKQNDIVVATFNDLSGQQTITLPSSGVYVLEVKSKEVNGFNRIAFNDGGDKLKITDIKQWGTIVWSSFSAAFWGCSNMLTTATDVPNLSNVNSMYAMFYGASLANPLTRDWDVSNVFDMFFMFFEATSANPNTENWDVSSVQDLDYMFYYATSANPDVSNWDVSSVFYMDGVFNNATSANPDTSNWDVSNALYMYQLFEGSNLSVENLTLVYENWSLLTLQRDIYFGAGTIKYNISGQAGRDILTNTYGWTIYDGGLLSPFIIEVDTSKIGVSNNNQFQFTGAEGDYDVVAKQNDIVVATFNDLSGEQTITLPSSGFYNLEVKSKEVNGFNRIQFNNSGDKLKITDIKQWGTIVWSSLERAFFGCENMLTTATDVPNLSNVNSMFVMFYNASSANPDTSNWDVSSVTDMLYMFLSATSANPDTTNWDVSNVTNMERMFQGATSANPNTTNWDVSSVTSMDRMFENSNISVENLTACYENWSQLTLKQNVEFGAGTIKYNASGQAGRDILVNTYNWSITDGGPA